MKESSVAIIVLNWNRRDLALQCLRSHGRLRYGNVSVLVADNGSRDCSVEVVRAEFPGVQLLSLPENLGYARGNNAGLETALEQHPAWIMFLNNDTEVGPDLLTALMEGAKRFPDGGVFGPKIYCGGENDLIWYAGGDVSLPLGRTRQDQMRYLTASGLPK